MTRYDVRDAQGRKIGEVQEQPSTLGGLLIIGLTAYYFRHAIMGFLVVLTLLVAIVLSVSAVGFVVANPLVSTGWFFTRHSLDELLDVGVFAFIPTLIIGGFLLFALLRFVRNTGNRDLVAYGKSLGFSSEAEIRAAVAEDPTSRDAYRQGVAQGERLVKLTCLVGIPLSIVALVLTALPFLICLPAPLILTMVAVPSMLAALQRDKERVQKAWKRRQQSE